MLCLSAARTESVDVLRNALGAVEPSGLMAIVVGGAAMTPEIAGELEATYADAQLDRRSSGCARFATR